MSRFGSTGQFMGATFGVILLLGPNVAASSTTLRDVDDTAETWIPLGGWTALLTRTVEVPASFGEFAHILVYGQAANDCDGWTVSIYQHALYVNDVRVLSYDPCVAFDTNAASWASFLIPILPGVTNTLTIMDERAAYYGGASIPGAWYGVNEPDVDQPGSSRSCDTGHSTFDHLDQRLHGSSCDSLYGELMWYLVTAQSGCQDPTSGCQAYCAEVVCSLPKSESLVNWLRPLRYEDPILCYTYVTYRCQFII